MGGLSPQQQQQQQQVGPGRYCSPLYLLSMSSDRHVICSPRHRHAV
jgi:hypothetical protein